MTFQLRVSDLSLFLKKGLHRQFFSSRRKEKKTSERSIIIEASKNRFQNKSRRKIVTKKNRRMRWTKFFDKNSRKKISSFFISSLKSFFFQKRNTKAKEQCYKSFPMKCEWREISRLRRLKKCLLGACIIKLTDLDSKTLLSSFFSRLVWSKK